MAEKGEIVFQRGSYCNEKSSAEVLLRLQGPAVSDRKESHGIRLVAAAQRSLASDSYGGGDKVEISM